MDIKFNLPWDGPPISVVAKTKMIFPPEPPPQFAYHILPRRMQWEIRAFLRKRPTWELRTIYSNLQSGVSTGQEILDRNRAMSISALREALWERGELKEEELRK